MSADTHRLYNEERVAVSLGEDIFAQFGREFGGYEIPTSELLSLYPARNPIRGFTREISFPDGRWRNLDVLLGQAAPFVAPTVAIRDDALFLKWPHVENDGVVCTPSAGISCSAETFIAAGLRVVQEALTNAERSISGENHDDFFEEMDSYWGHAAGSPSWVVTSCVTPGGDSREIRVASASGRTFIADDERALKLLLSRYSPGTAESLKSSSGYLLSLSSPLAPPDFPRNGRMLRTLVEGALPTHVDVLAASSTDCQTSPVYILQARLANGWFLGAARSRWSGNAKSNQRGYGAGRAAMPGFRDKKIRGAAAKHTIFSTIASVSLASIERLDDGVTLSRADIGQAPMKKNRVVMAGCGSLGSYLLDLLVKAGVGNFTLIDPETLTTQNPCRHTLGMQEVGANKVQALTDKVFRNQPWVASCEPIPKKIENLTSPQWNGIIATDVIISVIGHAGVESFLAHEARARGFQGPIIFCWLEPFAVAGHTLVSVAGDARLFELVDDVGANAPATAEWSDDIEIVRSEGGCGGSFQPYSAPGLAFHASIMARAVLGVLSRSYEESQHVISTVSSEELALTGGNWSDWWTEATIGKSGDSVKRMSCAELADLQRKRST